jgi:hypothetical protein
MQIQIRLQILAQVHNQPASTADAEQIHKGDADSDTEQTQSRYKVDTGRVQMRVQIRAFCAGQRPGPDAGADSRAGRRSGSRRLIPRCRPRPTARYCGRADPTPIIVC